MKSRNLALTFGMSLSQVSLMPLTSFFYLWTYLLCIDGCYVLTAIALLFIHRDLDNVCGFFKIRFVHIWNGLYFCFCFCVCVAFFFFFWGEFVSFLFVIRHGGLHNNFPKRSVVGSGF